MVFHVHDYFRDCMSMLKEGSLGVTTLAYMGDLLRYRAVTGKADELACVADIYFTPVALAGRPLFFGYSFILKQQIDGFLAI